MIKIGDFARLAEVSVVTLRHYDDMGLLKPVVVDRFTGYRYYSVRQLPRLHRIMALKDLGFSLQQIEQVLSGVTLEELQGMLKLKHAEAEERLAEEQARLARIRIRLRHIEMEKNMADYSVVLKNVAPVLVASCLVTIPTNDEVPEYLGRAYGNVWGFINTHQLKPQGSNMALWHQSAEILNNEKAEAMVPVDRVVPSSDAVQVYHLPEVQVASAVHEGEFDKFFILHQVLLKWIEENGYEIVGGYRELYLKHDPANLSDTLTEVQYPVRKQA